MTMRFANAEEPPSKNQQFTLRPGTALGNSRDHQFVATRPSHRRSRKQQPGCRAGTGPQGDGPDDELVTDRSSGRGAALQQEVDRAPAHLVGRDVGRGQRRVLPTPGARTNKLLGACCPLSKRGSRFRRPGQTHQGQRRSGAQGRVVHHQVEGFQARTRKPSANPGAASGSPLPNTAL